jgi:uncharacterized protein
MHWHMIMTERCNLKCEYCYGKSMVEENDLSERFKFDFDIPCSSNVDVGKLKSFLEKDENPVLIFYGGEPLLKIDRMKEIMDNLKDVSGIRFAMQTNGRLLDRLPLDYLMKFDKTLVSIDGDAERTDSQRGLGGYEIVTRNLRAIREKGYRGEIVARMTVTKPDIYEQVMHLVGLIEGDGLGVEEGALPQTTLDSAGRGLFDSVHWQLDAGFYAHDFDFRKFSEFVKEYNSGITRLVDWWVSEIGKGKVWKIYPFLGLFENLYYKKETKLMCGSGHSGYTITTDGNLVACPIMNGMQDFYAGSLDSEPGGLKKFEIGGRCKDCEVFGTCGGRCLYQNATRLWPPEGEELICDTIKHLISVLKSRMPEIWNCIQEAKVSEDDFVYEKYFGPEIIP